MPKPSDHDREVEEQQRYTASVSASIARASKRASQDLSDDVLRILDTYVAKGGFDSRQEAQEYLRGYIEPKDRAVLIEAARRLPEPERTQQLTRLSSAAYNWRMSRAQAVDKAQKLATTRLRREIEDRIQPVMDRTVRESTKQANFQMQKQIGFAYSFDMPNRRGIDQVVTGTGVYDKVRLFSQQEMIGVKEIIAQGMLSGRKAETLARDVQRQTGKQLYQARRLVRTTIAQASVDAKVKEFRELGIEEYEIVCTLDERTCPVCGRMDGKRFKLGEGPMPTFHPNCRCGIRQVLPDSVRGSLKRAARDSSGRSIQVPQSMTYAEWNRRFGTPAKQQALDLPDKDVVKEQQSPVDLSKIKGFSDKVPEVTQKSLKKQIDEAPDFVQNAWKSTAADLSISDPNHEGVAYYRLGDGVHYNHAEDSKGRKMVGTDGEVHQIEMPNSILTHELGHNISYVASARAGNGVKDFADIFRSSQHQKEDGEGYTLTEMVEFEAQEYVKKIWKSLKDEAAAKAPKGVKPEKVPKDHAYRKVSEELRSLPYMGCGDVSDMFGGATKNKAVGYMGHRDAYWKSTTVGTEAFAEMMSASIANPESLKNIKKYFPRSYEIFEEMLRSLL